MTSFDQRKQERINVESKIEYILNHTDQVFLEGDIVDITESGLCFQTTKELREGQEIIIKNNLPVNSQIATVVWIEKINDNYYKVGLQIK